VLLLYLTIIATGLIKTTQTLLICLP